jgi:DNA-binding MarR family transcriptional regulator
VEPDAGQGHLPGVPAITRGHTGQYPGRRLKRLQAAGIIDRNPCQQKPVRYRYPLTARGRDLSPAIHALIDWSERHLEGVLGRAGIETMLAAGSAPKQ